MLIDRYRTINKFLETKANFIKAFFFIYPFDVVASILRHQEYFDSNPSGVYVMAIFSQLITLPICLVLLQIRARYFHYDTFIGRNSSFLLLLIMGAIIGVSKVLVHYQMFADYNSWIFRIFSVVISFPAFSYFVISLYQVYEQIRRNIKSLESQNRELIKTQAKYDADVQALFVEVKDLLISRVIPVVTTLKSELSLINKFWSASLGIELMHKVEHLSDHIIRSESHELYKNYQQQEASSQTPIGSLNKALNGLKEILRYMRTPNPIVPLAIFPLVALYGQSACQNQFLVLIVILTSLSLALRQVEKLSAGRVQYLGISSIIILVTTSIWYLDFVQNYDLLACNFNQYPNLKYFGLILILLLMISSTFYTSILAVMEANYIELTAEKLVLKAQIADSKRFLSKTANEFANALHGEIQSGLAGISMAVQLMRSKQQSSKPEPDMQALQLQIAQKFSLVEQKIDELLSLQLGERPLISDAVEELINRWSGLLSIEVFMTTAARELLAKDVQLSYVVVEVLHEIATNSVRHGASTQLNLNVSTTADGFENTFLQVQATNNGKPLESMSSALGLLSKQIRKLGGVIQIELNPAGGVSTLVQLPI